MAILSNDKEKESDRPPSLRRKCMSLKIKGKERFVCLPCIQELKKLMVPKHISNPHNGWCDALKWG